MKYPKTAKAFKVTKKDIEPTLGEVKPNEIKFCLENGKEEVLRITKGSFYYRGEKVEDVHNVYERFSEWLSMAHGKPEQPTTTQHDKRIDDVLENFSKLTDQAVIDGGDIFQRNYTNLHYKPLMKKWLRKELTSVLNERDKEIVEMIEKRRTDGVSPYAQGVNEALDYIINNINKHE